MKKNIGIATMLILVMSLAANAQQTFTYTQYMNNLTPMVPAYSLLDKSPSVSLITRKQWAGIDGAPRTSIFNGSVPLPKANASAGAFVVLDEVAVEKRTEVNFFFAKAVQLNEHTYFSASLNGGVSTYKAAYSSLDPFDQSYRDDISETNGIVGFSLMLFDPDKYYLGVSLPRTNMKSFGSDTSFTDRNWKNTWFISGGYIQPLNEIFTFKPAVLVSYAKDQKTQADISATFYWMEQLGVGVNYRTTKEVAGIISYTYQHKISIGYSYQLSGSNDEISGMSNGSHELALRYRFGKQLAAKLL